MTARALSLAADIIKAWEGCRTLAYADTNGTPTIGYGHTKGVRLGVVCAQTQADAWLIEDMASAAASVASLVRKPLTDHQRASLISFVFNVGTGNFRSSTMLKLLNAGDYTQAGKQFAFWVHGSNGQLLNGLVKRRNAEANLFNSPDQPVKGAAA